MLRNRILNNKGKIIVMFEKSDGSRYVWEKDVQPEFIVQVERFFKWLNRKEVQDLIGFFNILRSIGLI